MVLAYPHGHSKRIGDVDPVTSAPVPKAPIACDVDGLVPAPPPVARAARSWVLVRFRRRGRVLGANMAGDAIVAVGDVVGIVEYDGSGRGFRPLVACVRCGRRTPSPVLLFKRRRDLDRPLDPILCASCSQGWQRRG
jgi:hypothetical protein